MCIVYILNSCPADLFVSIFYSFEAGIANAISSFKWRNILDLIGLTIALLD